jgi:glutamate carboxypeptidase
MMDTQTALGWLDGQSDEMLRLVTDWAGINSGTHNLAGIDRLAALVEREFASLGGEMKYHDLPPLDTIDSAGNPTQVPLHRVVSFTLRPHAPLRVMLCIHLDTVYAATDRFKEVTQPDKRTLRGPGVADAKGGIVVMLFALRAFEQMTELAPNLGWQVVLNADEEIGSPRSAPVLVEASKQHHVGLVFEPCLPDGSLVGARKGSGNFTIVVRGIAAHAGRDFHLGRSAVLALADLVTRLDAAQRDMPSVTMNVGRVEGGGALNIVPALAMAHVNVRITNPNDQPLVEQRIAQVAEEVGRRDGITVKVHGGFHSPPKPLDPHSVRLFEAVAACGKELGLEIQVHPSGGACDGNRLVAAGLPVVDTMGPRGGHLHSDQEYIVIDSLVDRAMLTTLLLIKLARGEVEP